MKTNTQNNPQQKKVESAKPKIRIKSEVKAAIISLNSNETLVRA